MSKRIRIAISLMMLLALAFPAMSLAAAARTGAWVDEVVFVEETDQNKAVARIESGELDIFTLGISQADLFKRIKASSTLDYDVSYGSYNELTLNPAGPVLNNGKLNPFAAPAIREAINWLLDRNYIANELMGGLGVPRYTALNTAFADYARYADIARGIELKYAYNFDKAKQVITEEMTKLGATMSGGKWIYKGEPVSLIFLIRPEDERKLAGDYIANQMEKIGFTIDRQYKRAADASPLWNASNPADGKWNLYTGGWVSTLVNRDLGDNFSYFFTPRGRSSPLWQAYKPEPEYDEVAKKLSFGNFSNLAERRDLFAKALELSMKDSVRIFYADKVSVWPRSKDVVLGTDIAGGMSASRIWGFTARFTNKIGGKIGVANTGMLVEPWNPLAGTNWTYDQMIARGTGESAALPDPFTGLYMPQRVKKAEVTYLEGTPAGKTLDWVDLKFAKEIKVPADAWIDWDAKAQKFITVGEKYPEGLSTKVKSVITFDENLFRDVKWHDGSAVSLGDMLIHFILLFDVAKKDSAIFDEAEVSSLEAFQTVFKGARLVKENPVTIEFYTDQVYLDAEYNAYDPCFYFWPYYNYGPGAWHNLALGIKADAAKELTFSKSKSDALKLEWMSFIAGPSLSILSKKLDQATSESYIPYAPTLGKYITAKEVASRYTNLRKWYQEKNHFWIGTGVFYLDQVRPVEKIVTLKRFADFPDSAEKWAGFGQPKLAVVDTVGPSPIRKKTAVEYSVNVTFQGKAYPMKDVAFVKYMVFDSKDNMVLSGEANAVKDGQWKVSLSANDTAKLPAGSTRLEIIVAPNAVSIPAFDNLQFVTLP